MRPGPQEEATHRGTPISGRASVGPLRDEPLVAIVTTSAGGIILPVPERSPFIVGRGADCELTIPDLSVSRRHLRISVGNDLRVEDLSSANGTSYEGRRLRPYEETVIELGRALTIGSVTVFVHAAQAVVAPGRAAGPGVLFTPPVVEVVRDEASKRVYALVPTIAPSPLSVLVLGETGVGKEVFADAIHRGSRRAHKPFLKLNCAALPESILEGELFGYERGAFSGAVVARPGLFEAAHEATDFVASSLWIEGLATYASLALDPRANADEALPFSHLHRADDPQLDAPSRRVLLSREMPGRVATLGPRLLACLRSKADDDYADFFLGRATPRMDGQPARSGYWFGLELARRIAGGKDLRAMASVRPSALLGEMESQLERLIAEHPRGA